MEYSKYKDADPIETVKKAKKTLAELGIQMNEVMQNPVDGIYSVRLTDPKHGWGVNGKGTTPEYCMASGFGEAMERFQSCYAYNWGMAGQEAQQHLNFFRAPDELVLPIEHIKEKAPVVWETMKHAWGGAPSDEELLDVWTELVGERVSLLPYHSFKENNTVLLPDYVISSLDGSNGLAAGNTPEEALCQGLSEVTERYVQERVITERMTPPEIPICFLKQEYPTLFALIHRIEEASGHRLYVKDASLGKGFPVVCVVLLDIKKQRYHVKFGAHPTFAVALERCLTELLQGYTPGNPQQDDLFLTTWSAQPCIPFDSIKNLSNQFRDGTGVIADEYFAGTPSWEFVPWGANQDFTNHQGMTELCEKLSELAGDVYMRDMGYLGFPTYRIFVPDVSRNKKKINRQMLRDIRTREWICSLNETNSHLTKEKAHEAVLFLERTDTDKNYAATLGGSLPFPLLHAGLLRDAGDLGRAAELLREIEMVSGQYRCAAMEIELQKKGCSEAMRDEMLSTFFDAISVAYAKRYWRGESTIENLFSSSIMQEKEMAANKKESEDMRQRMENISALHMRVKEKMREGVRNQEKIRELF